MMSPGHMSVGITLFKSVFAKHGHSIEYVILSDSRFDQRLREKCPFARVRLYKNPSIPDDYDMDKDEDPTSKHMDEFAKSFGQSLETRMIHQTEAFKGMAMMLKQQTSEIENILKEEAEGTEKTFVFFDHLFSIPYFMNANIPWGFLCSANPLYIQYDEEGLPPFGSGLSAKPGNESKWEEFRIKYKQWNQPFQQFLNSWLSESGCETLPDGHFILGSPFLNIYLFPKEIDYFEPNDKRLRGHWLSVDSCILPEKLKEAAGEKISKLELDLDSFPNKDPKRRLVYFSLGTLVSTQSNLMQRIVDLLGTIEHNFVVSKGARGDRLEMPSNCIGQNFLNQVELLPHVQLMITHGGNNTLTECLHYGVPVIILPVFGDVSLLCF